MKTVSGSPFRLLAGAGLFIAAVSVAGLAHAFIFYLPDSWEDLRCTIIPTGIDPGSHLITYLLAGLIVGGVFRGVTLWRRRRRELTFLNQYLQLAGTMSRRSDLQLSELSSRVKTVLIDCETPFCFCSGFISPCVYLSKGMAEMMTPEELEAVMLHETHHAESRDPLKMLIGQILVSTLFFVPVLRDLFKQYLLNKELMADQRAIYQQGHNRGVAGAMCKMLEWKSAPIESFAASSSDLLELRIDSLTGTTPVRYRISPRNLAVSVIAIAGLVFDVLALQPLYAYGGH